MNIFTEIKKEMEKQRVTEQELEKRTGIPQSTVNRIINNKNKKLDLPKIRAIENALGIVAETAPAYAATAHYQQTTPEENELLDRFRRLDKQHRLQLMEIAICYEGFCGVSKPAEPLVTDSTESGYGQKSSGGVGG